MNDWSMSKEVRGVPKRDTVGELGKVSKRDRKTMTRGELAHEIRKATDLATGRTSPGRVMTSEEAEAFMERRG
jgi:hypothetical protein